MTAMAPTQDNTEVPASVAHLFAGISEETMRRCDEIDRRWLAAIEEAARVFTAAGCDPAAVRACPGGPLFPAAADLMDTEQRV